MPDLGAFLTTLLSYLDKPWKVIGLIALIFFGLIAFTAYERRAEIASALLRGYSAPHLELAKFKEKAPLLLKNANADAVMLLRLNFEANWLEPQVGYSRDGAQWMPDPSPRPLLHFSTKARTVIDVINGDPICRDLTGENLLTKREYEAGARRICFIGVPPVTGILVGLLVLFWETPLSPAEEYIATQNLRTTAMQIADY